MNFVFKIFAAKDASSKRTYFSRICLLKSNSRRKFSVLARKLNAIRSIVPALQLALCVEISVHARDVSIVPGSQRMVWMWKRITILLLNNSWHRCQCLKICSLNLSCTIVNKAEPTLIYVLYIIHNACYDIIYYLQLFFDYFNTCCFWYKDSIDTTECQR